LCSNNFIYANGLRNLKAYNVILQQTSNTNMYIDGMRFSKLHNI